MSRKVGQHSLGAMFLMFIFSLLVSSPALSDSERKNLKDAQYDQAPDFVLPDMFSGEKIKLSDYRGKAVLIDFWASWCGPCRQSMPEYNALREKLQKSEVGQDFEILAINVDVTTEEAMHFLKRYPVDFPILEERSGESQRAYDLLTLPTSFLIDPEGYIRIAHQGFNTGYIHYLEKEVKAILQE